MADGGRVLLTTDITPSGGAPGAHAGCDGDGAGRRLGGDPRPDHRLRYVNPAFTRLTGWSAEEAIGRRRRSSCAATTTSPPSSPDRGDAERRQGLDGPIVSRHKDGHPIHKDATISPILDERGRLTTSVAVNRDVTDQIRPRPCSRRAGGRTRRCWRRRSTASSASTARGGSSSSTPRPSAPSATRGRRSSAGRCTRS